MDDGVSFLSLLLTNWRPEGLGDDCYVKDYNHVIVPLLKKNLILTYHLKFGQMIENQYKLLISLSKLSIALVGVHFD